MANTRHEGIDIEGRYKPLTERMKKNGVSERVIHELVNKKPQIFLISEKDFEDEEEFTIQDRFIRDSKPTYIIHGRFGNFVYDHENKFLYENRRMDKYKSTWLNWFEREISEQVENSSLEKWAEKYIKAMSIEENHLLISPSERGRFISEFETNIKHHLNHLPDYVKIFVGGGFSNKELERLSCISGKDYSEFQNPHTKDARVIELRTKRLANVISQYSAKHEGCLGVGILHESFLRPNSILLSELRNRKINYYIPKI